MIPALRRFLLLAGFLLVCVCVSCACGDEDSSSDSTSDDDAADDDAATHDDDAADDDSGDDTDDDAEPPPPWIEPASPLREDVSLDGTWLFTPEGFPEREVPVPCHWEAIDEWDGWEQYTCPEYLAGTPDETVSIIEGQNWEDRAIQRGSYRRVVTLDRAWPVVRAGIAQW